MLVLLLILPYISATGKPTCDNNNCCCYANGCAWHQCSYGGSATTPCIPNMAPPAGCDMNPTMEVRKVKRAMLLDPVPPTTGVVDSGAACGINCEWFQRAVRTDNPSKPCVFTGSRRDTQCTVESICTNCQNMIYFPKQILYTSATDLQNARCPVLPDEIDTISDKMFQFGFQQCVALGGCTCISDNVNKDAIILKGQ